MGRVRERQDSIDGRVGNGIENSLAGSEIAVIGMTCRLPGASTIDEYWRNLRAGVESLIELSDEELRAAGVPEAQIADPSYVRRASVIEGIELFDAAFFGYTPLEATIMDPQHRLFLECAWEVFEQAGYDPASYPRPIGVFTGAKTNTYLFNVVVRRSQFSALDNFQIALGNDLAAMATRVSYKLDLRGPSYALHTACSTSLVAVHLACQSLLLDECSMALAGGAAINVPQRRGYRYQKGGILSPDGSCRTFDAAAAGTNFGNGVGAVLLKRLEDALADGDHVYAVIRGSATNNDGAAKASFTAPGVEGQTAVLLEAMAAAGVEAEDISYVEAHGTATELGDSIEMLALTQAFRATTKRQVFCAIGSVKPNLGHLETVAGVAGLIKTALALERRQLPPSINFQRPNPKIDFASSPFVVNDELRPWPEPPAGKRRVAGVSSLGIGSANAHVILEEPPPRPATSAATGQQLLLLSARSTTALAAMTSDLSQHLADHPQLPLADVAHTLQVGRRRFAHRRAAVCRDREHAVDLLRRLGESPKSGMAGVADLTEEAVGRPVAFLLPGLGDHRLDLARGLYEAEPTFRRELDRACDLLVPLVGEDLRRVLYPERPVEPPAGKPDLRRMLRRGGAERRDAASRQLDATRRAQPVLFAAEHALARMWMAWGVVPRSLIGYSLGEYVAACLAGVLRLEDALALVAGRARLIDRLEEGAMLGVSLGEKEVLRLAGDELSLAAVNGPGLSVVAGPVAAVAALEARLGEHGVACRRLATTHAFHSRMMDEIAAELEELVRGCELRAPEIPYVSNVTGTWITAEEATDPAYWARHLCSTVRFREGVETLLSAGAPAMLEMGTGQSLCSFVKLHPQCDAAQAARVVASLPGAFDEPDDELAARLALGRLWLSGVDVDWSAYHAGERRRRVPLPTYPFERQRYWLEQVTEAELAAEMVAAGSARDPGAMKAGPALTQVTLDKKEDLADWFYVPAWRPAELPGVEPQAAAEGSVVLFTDGGSLAAAVAARLTAEGRTVIEVVAAEEAAASTGLKAIGEARYGLQPDRPEAYAALLDELGTRGQRVSSVLHLWSLAPAAAPGLAERWGFFSLLFLAQALGRKDVKAVAITVVTHGVQRVTEGESVDAEAAAILGPSKVIPQEMPGVACRAIDVELPEAGSRAESQLARQLLGEMAVTAADETAHELVAYRRGRRFEQGFEALRLGPAAGKSRLREGGVYLVTGGLGGLGLALAEHLARGYQARLALVGRSAFPQPERWDAWLAEHGEGDATSAKIRTLQAMEEAGAEVLTLGADVAERQQMERVRDRVRERFGSVDGIVHAAGVPGGGIIQLKTTAMAREILRPKVEGARVLAAVFAGDEIDFLVVYSSVASILGEFGQADYCGANAFLDAFAHSRAGGSPPTVAINWDIWREVGLAVYTEVPPHLRAWRQEMLAKGILSREGVDVFERALAAGQPQIVVSTQDLAERIELGKSFTGERFLAELGMGPAAPTPVPASTAGLGRHQLERRLADVWRQVLGVDVRVDDNFFDLGGNSLVGLQLVNLLSRELGVQVAPVELFEHPTVAALARHLRPDADEAGTPAPETRPADDDVAIIGMCGRFPGANSVDELWENLRAGVESVRFFTDEELAAAGVAPALLADPKYVRAGAVIDGVDLFDAALFGYSPREAEVMDPQQRIFLECAWEALETAGYDPQRYGGRIGVFAGANLSTYLLQLHADPEVAASINMLQAILGNDKDALTTRTSYKLDLRGPSVAVQTFCSTSLVAVHMAARSLLDGDCDMALAGGIRVVVPVAQGYLYEERGISPRDGHTRPFDAKATGSVLGNGIGIVVLKRLSEAVSDRDPIRAVIRGSAINNDGSLKAGYTAPSVDGQVQVVRAALAAAGVDPASVSYVEAHGSATELGDPIEVTALARAYSSPSREAPCAIGSVKSNFGHLDRAAGVTGLIKAVLALEHQAIPPSINFEEPNPQIDFTSSPFRVAAELVPWETDGAPRRAGVNSLGMGGTNVHVIVEQAPAMAPAGAAARPWQLLLLSANSPWSLDEATRRLAEHLEARPELDLADVAYTLQVGRRGLGHRRMLVCCDGEDAVAGLVGDASRRRLLTGVREDGERSVVFLFPGLGGQYPQMARELYDGESVFRSAVDRCAEILTPLLGADLRAVIYPARPEEAPAAGNEPHVDLRRMLRRGGDEAEGPLRRTVHSQPALFMVEYALAQQWLHWGVRPDAMFGYSIGEYVAACLAGVLSLEEALKLVARRAQLIAALPPGGMLAVAMSRDEAGALLAADPELSLAAVNTPEQTVLGGPLASLDAVEKKLAGDGVGCRRLQVTHAFHSAMMQAAFDELAELAADFELHPPRIPYVSNLTGTWIRDEDATDPSYWARHMCGTVRFSDGLETLLEGADRVMLEVGPQALASLVLQHPAAAAGSGRETVVLASLRHAFERGSDVAHLLSTLGKLWITGVEVDWQGVHDAAPRRRLPLPTYPFDRQRYWIETRDTRRAPAAAALRLGERHLYGLGWQRRGTDWRPSLEPAGAAAAGSRGCRPAGSFVVIGGLSDSGFEIVAGLRAGDAARLALVETGLPPRESWTEWLESDAGEGVVSRQIRRARALEGEGVEILAGPPNGDAAAALPALVGEARAGLGELHGVICVVGPEPSPEVLARLLAVDRVTRDPALDFRLLVASAAFTEGAIPAACASFYAALRLLLEGAAGNGATAAPAWRSILWETGGDVATAGDVLDHLLRLDAGQVVVSNRPLELGEETFSPAAAPGREDASRIVRNTYARPDLRVEYVAPRNEVEETIAGIWQELLGVGQIGIHDNFLELGGDSLLATRMITRMRDVLGLELPIRLFFEASTVAELAAAVERLREEATAQELAEMMELIGEMSEEELDRELLRREGT